MCWAWVTLSRTMILKSPEETNESALKRGKKKSLKPTMR